MEYWEERRSSMTDQLRVPRDLTSALMASSSSGDHTRRLPESVENRVGYTRNCTRYDLDFGLTEMA